MANVKTEVVQNIVGGIGHGVDNVDTIKDGVQGNEIQATAGVLKSLYQLADMAIVVVLFISPDFVHIKIRHIFGNCRFKILLRRSSGDTILNAKLIMSPDLSPASTPNTGA